MKTIVELINEKSSIFGKDYNSNPMKPISKKTFQEVIAELIENWDFDIDGIARNYRRSHNEFVDLLIDKLNELKK